MTGDLLALDRPALRDALAHIRIESPDGEPFEEALARENGWTLGFAERVADEYSGFLYLATTAGFEVTPSECVDRAWHLHLTWPHYRDVLCGEIIGRPLEHRPGTGEPGEDERYRVQYEQTFALYQKVFAKAPPGDIWPRPDPESAAPKAERKRARWLSWRAALICLVVALPAAAFAKILAVVLLGGALIFFLLGLPFESSARAAARKPAAATRPGAAATATAARDAGADAAEAAAAIERVENP